MLLHTFADAQAIPPKRMWQALRTMRHHPPGRAARRNRRDTFNGAIEQAEQLFAAAEATDPAARPILLFYGLSQLGRAIAAVSTALDNKEYRLYGHGLDHGSLGGAARHGLANVIVWGHASGAFPVVARALGADALQQRRRLGDIWAVVPDADRFPLPGSGELKSLQLYSELPHGRTEGWTRGLLTKLPLRLLLDDDEEPVTGYGPELSRLMEVSESESPGSRGSGPVVRLAGAVPKLGRLGIRDAPDGPAGYRLHDGGRSLDLPLRFPKPPKALSLPPSNNVPSRTTRSWPSIRSSAAASQPIRSCCGGPCCTCSHDWRAMSLGTGCDWSMCLSRPMRRRSNTYDVDPVVVVGSGRQGL